MVGLSFNPSPEAKRRMADLLGRLLPVVGDIRRLPAALDLCYLAAGRLDGTVCLDTRLWDIAAGLLIAEEAGAVLGGAGGAAGAAGTELALGAAPRCGRSSRRCSPSHHSPYFWRGCRLLSHIPKS